MPVCDIHYDIINELFDRENYPCIVNDIYRNLHEKEGNYNAEILMSEYFHKYMEKCMGICFSSSDKVSNKEKEKIVSYLKNMHVLADIDVETTLKSIDTSHRIILILPGMRRQFCDEMMHFLQSYKKDEYWNCLDDAEKEKAINAVKGAFYGRIFEDCILYECMRRAEKEAEETGVALRVYRFENSRQDAGPGSPWGEFDMVIRASSGGWTRYALFEAKCTASARKADRHCQHLRKEDLLREACPDGLVALRAVLYNGGPLEVSGGVSAIPGPIRYLNASQFLADAARHGLLALFGADRPRRRLDAAPEDGEAPLAECMAAEGADSASRQAPVFPASPRGVRAGRKGEDFFMDSGRSGGGSMRPVLLEDHPGADKFRRHVGKYMCAHGWRAGALYLSMFLLAPASETRGMAELCRRLGIGRLGALSFCKPYAFFNERWYVYESCCALPREWVNFSMAQEIAELLQEEPDVRLEDGMYWREEPIDENAPSRDFAFELCLPSPKMAGYRARGLCAGDIALRCGLARDIVSERLAMEDLPPAAIERAAEDFRKCAGAARGDAAGPGSLLPKSED